MKRWITFLGIIMITFVLSSCGRTNDITEVLDDIEDVKKISFDNMENQLESIQTILLEKCSEDILEIFNNSLALENGNVLVEGKFANIEGEYEVYCWNNQIYQVVFRWDEDLHIDGESIVNDVMQCAGQYVNYNPYWDIYEWEYKNIEISFVVEDGVWFENILDLENPKLEELKPVSISEDIYTKLSKEGVEQEIKIIKNLVEYKSKPKMAIYEEYSQLVDDDWNRLIMPGILFGIEGQYCIMYDRETGLINSVGFDWIPDDKKIHEEYVVNALSMYFGDCTETDTFRSDVTYYVHDWDSTTEENWSVHLSMTNETGWLQFSELQEKNKDTLKERIKADDYDKVIEAMTICFEYIPDCELFIGDEDAGSSNSYVIYAKDTIIGILGIDIDTYDCVVLVDRDKENVDLYFEQVSIALIMAVDSTISYEDAKELFDSSDDGGSTMISIGIYGFKGIVNDMFAYGIDSIWF